MTPLCVVVMSALYLVIGGIVGVLAIRWLDEGGYWPDSAPMAVVIVFLWPVALLCGALAWIGAAVAHLAAWLPPRDGGAA